MSTKFEQLLDLIVNEEMDKANELFHEIVVEKSRNIYENLIAEEAAEEDVEEDATEDTDDMEESVDDDVDESVDLEDSYSMEADDDMDPEAGGLEKTDDFGDDIGATDDEEGGEFDDDEGGEGAEDAAIFDIKNAIADLEAAFAELEAAQGQEASDDEFDDADDMGGNDIGDEEPMGKPAFEGRRMTREYTEKVGNDWEKNSQKAQGQYLGAGTGEKDGAPVEGRSPISSGAGKPVGGKNVGAGNIVRGDTEGQSNTGDRPAKVNKGINPESSEKFARGIHNVDGAKSGVKTLSNVKGGHGAEKKGAGPGPVGSGTGDKAGQTSVGKIPQFLKPAN
jgi:hypothetical protein